MPLSLPMLRLFLLCDATRRRDARAHGRYLQNETSEKLNVRRRDKWSAVL